MQDENVGSYTERVLTAALRTLEFGLRPIPITAGKKKPALVPWKEFQHRAPTEEEVRGWFKKWPNANLAILNGFVGSWGD